MKRPSAKTLFSVIAILVGGVVLTTALVMTVPDHLRTIGERLSDGL